jgi:hypothetical protein
MLETIIACIISGSLPLGAYIGYQRFWPKNKIFPKVSNPEVNVDPESGMTIVDYKTPDETEEEYLSRLKFIHSNAWQEFRKYDSRPIAYDADRHINLLILNAERGIISYKIGAHTLDFNTTEEVWISNRYYSFGNLYMSKQRPDLVFDGTNYRLSAYTFLKLVDFIKERSEHAEWKREHDAYQRRRHAKLLKERLL